MFFIKTKSPKQTVYGRGKKQNKINYFISGENKEKVQGRIIRDFRKLFEQEQEEDYYEPKRVKDFWNNDYIEYESNGDKNSNLSLEGYLNKIKPYLKNIINDLQNSDTSRIQLKIEINFITSKDAEEERLMH